jgi:transcriptional regulator with XRE-family HTH domain/SOS-response transcriptional repressor LexA
MHATDPATLDPHALGQRIATLRHANGWSQRRLAEAAGVSHGYIALLELGRLPSPGKFRLDAVARALNVRTSDALLAASPIRSETVSIDPDSGDLAVRELLAPLDKGSEPASQARDVRADGRSRDQDYGSPEPLVPESLSREPLALEASPDDGSARTSPTPPAQAWRSAESPLPRPTSELSVAQGGNVLGSVEQLRSVGARPLPVFRWGACGDPRDQLSPPDPDRLEYPPPGRETLIGSSGFGVVVKGDSMAGRGIHDGDVVWVNPERAYGLGKVVLALVSDVDGEAGEAGMVVKTFARTEVGDCLLSETAAGRSPVVCREFKVIGPVVGVTSWRLPS